MSALLTALQAAVATRLSEHAFFSASPAIPVVTEQIKDIESAIQQTIARLGVCVIVVTPSATVEAPGVSGPELKEITLIARVIENPILNQTLQPAAYVAEIVARLLHLWRPTIDARTQAPLLCGGIALGNDPRHLSYDVTFSTTGHLDPDPATFVRLE